MVDGYPSENVWELDLKRFGALQSSRTFLRHRVMEVMRKWSFVLALLRAGVFFGACSVIQRAGFPPFFSNRFKLSLWCLTVSGLCRGHGVPVMFAECSLLHLVLVYFMGQDSALTFRCNSCQTQAASSGVFPALPASHCVWKADVTVSALAPHWSLGSPFAFQCSELANLLSKLQASLSDFCH